MKHTLGAIMTACLLWTAGCDSKPDTANEQEAKREAGEAGDKMKEALKETGEAVVAGAKVAGDKTEEVIDKTAEELAPKIEKAGEELREVGKDIGDKVRARTGDAMIETGERLNTETDTATSKTEVVTVETTTSI